jgi:NDP-sugar pyrophosphorylase family protein
MVRPKNPARGGKSTGQPVAEGGLESITAAILAGGLGTRLRRVVPDRPKVLADVGGRPFLAYLLDALAERHVRRVVICTGYRAGQVREALGSTFRGMALAYSQEETPLGTGGALRQALPLLASDDVLVMNGDSYCRVDVGEFLRFHRSLPHPPVASIVVVQVRDAGRFGRVLFDRSGRITAFEEKKRSAGGGWVNAGLYLLSRNRISEIPADTEVSLERELFPKWIGGGMHAWRSEGPFIDIGSPASYRKACSFFRLPDHP